MADFHQLGFGAPAAISASHGEGVVELLERALEGCAEPPAEPEVAGETGRAVLHLEADRVRVRREQQALAPRPHRVEALARPRQVADVLVHLGLQRRDVEVELLAPVIHAVPVERAALRIEPRVQLRDRLLGGHAVLLAPAPRQHVEPEQVVEAQVEHRSVHVEADGTHRVPVGRVRRGVRGGLQDGRVRGGRRRPL